MKLEMPIFVSRLNLITRKTGHYNDLGILLNN